MSRAAVNHAISSPFHSIKFLIKTKQNQKKCVLPHKSVLLPKMTDETRSVFKFFSLTHVLCEIIKGSGFNTKIGWMWISSPPPLLGSQAACCC